MTGFVAISNLSASTAVQSSILVTDAGARLLASHTVTVSPHGTKLVRLNEIRLSSSPNGGIQVAYTRPREGVAITGGLQDSKTGYSAGLPFAIFPSFAENIPATDC